MTVQIGTALTIPQPSRFVTGAPIRANTYDTLVKTLHRHYVRFGAHCGGQVFEESAPWETDSATFTATNDNIGLRLTDGQGCAKAPRKVEDVHERRLIFIAMMRRCDLRLKIIPWDGAVSIVDETITQGAAWAWVSQLITITDADASLGGIAGAAARPLQLVVEGKANDIDPAQVLHWGVREAILTNNADIPR